MTISINGTAGITFPDGSVQTTAFNSGSGVSSFSGAGTGLTPATAQTGAVTLSGILNTTSGGTGAASPTGIQYFNGASPATAATGAQVATLLGTTPVGKATNIAGGVANQIPYQTAASTTGFVAAPSTANTVLGWNGSAFAWVPQGDTFVGTWNANTNTPALASGVGIQGNYYIVSVAGNTTLDGISGWQVGDWAIFDGGVWNKVGNSAVGVFTDLTVTTSADLTTSGAVVIDSGTLGSIDNVTIGATSPSTGAFTTLTADTSANFSPTGTVTIAPTVAGSINNMAIGAATASTVRGTTVTATTQFTGPGTGLTGTAASLTAGLASDLAGGANLQVPYQTAANTTVFTPAATLTGTALVYDGAGLSWSAAPIGQTTNALTAGTGLNTTPAATTFNGSAAVTFKLADTAVAPGVYGSPTTIPVITVDQQGRITLASSTATVDLSYQGTWNANTNTPSLADGTGTSGDYYVCNVAGSQDLGSGTLVFNIGDWAIYDGAVWELVNNSQTTSVANFTITGISANQLLLGGGTSPIYGAGFGTAGQALISAGAGLAPAWTTLGTMSTQNANAVAITGGTITGVPISGGTVSGTTITATTQFTGPGTGLTGTAAALNIGGNAATATTATNLAGGLANQIAVQSGPGATTFIAAPTVANTALEWNGAAFAWTAVTGTTTNALTVNNLGAGTASPFTFDGSAAKTLSYNSVGAAGADGTGASGTWGISISGTAADATNIAGGLVGSLPYQTAVDTTTFLAAGTNGQVLTLAGGVPTWASAGVATTATNLANGAAGSLPYQTAANTTAFLAAGTNGFVLTLAGGVPTWAASTGGVTSFSGGTTGLTPNTATTGAIVLAGTLAVANGGTGATTLTGYVKGAGTAAMTASATIPTTDLSGTITNAQLANSSVTVNGTAIALGASGTITANTTNALTAGTGLNTTPAATTFNGSAAVTFKLADTAVTPGVYGSSTTIPVITVDQQGRITLASQTATIDLAYQGTWNATTNSPSIADGTGTQGDYYVCNVAGTQNLGSGALVFNVGDWAIYNGAIWQLVTNSQTTSVANFTITGIPEFQVLLGGGTNPISGLSFGTSGQVLTSGGNAATPTWTTLGTMASQAASGVTITGGTINGTTIGGTTAAAVTGTTITANTQFTGPGTGLTGTAASLNIGGNAATANSATNLAGGGANTIVYQSASGTTAFLTNGTNGQVLTANTGAAPTWQTVAATNVNLSAGAGATNYIPFATSATGSQALTTDAGLTYNVTTQAITGGIDGGVF